MFRYASWGLACAAAALAAPGISRAADCAGLKAFSGGDLQITAAELAERPWQAPAALGPAVTVSTPICRVQAVAEGDIGIELWMPAPGAWNGRFLGVGVGGNAGVFNYRDAAMRVAQGFAVASTDSGHKEADANWMMRDRAVENYAHRAEHVMTVKAKAIATAYYGAPANRSYFLGCSGGGRQALKELQRYPTDYDGVVAGAPGPDMPVMSVRHLRAGLYEQRNPAGAMTDRHWDIVGQAVTKRCDMNDGVADGVIEDPRACRFDPAEVQCKTGQTEACLTADQVRTVQTFYAPLRDENGVQLDDGLFPGVRTRPGPPSPLLLQLFAHGLHRDPNWDPQTFHMARDLAGVRARMPEMTANDPAVEAFRDRGGKVILYSGWMDPSVIAQQSIAYYDAVSKRFGGPGAADGFMRLFLAPGVLHCQGGPGPDRFGGSGQPAPTGDPDSDMLWSVIRWVEGGKAPDRIVAAKALGDKVLRTRPLCPYPALAVYKGKGSTDDAANFTCGTRP